MDVATRDLQNYFDRRLAAIRTKSDGGISGLKSASPLIVPALRLAEELLRATHGPGHYELSVWTSPETPEIVAYYDSSSEERPKTFLARQGNPHFYREKKYEVIKLLDSPSSEPIVKQRVSAPDYSFIDGEQQTRIKSTILFCFDVGRPAAIVVTSDRSDCFSRTSSDVDLLRCLSLAIKGDLDLFEPRPSLPRQGNGDSSRQYAYSWIHLSDIHFGAGTDSHELDLRRVGDALVTDLKRLPEAPNAIFVTGDVAFRGARNEYEEAAKWIGAISEASHVPIERVRFVPGNHDVQWAITADGWPDIAKTRDLESARKNHEDVLLARFSNYVNFIRDLVQDHPRDPQGGVLDWTEAFECEWANQKFRVRVVGLSTVWISDELDGKREETPSAFQANMTLCVPQLELLRQSSGHRELVFLLTHHPPEWLFDKWRVALHTALDGIEHLHLCGHIHVGEAIADRKFGTGKSAFRFSAGATHDEEPKGSIHRMEHGYGWGAIRLTENGWQVGWAPRVYVPARKEFRPDRTRYDLDSAGYDWQPLRIDQAGSAST